jgi:hypothetical protein
MQLTLPFALVPAVAGWLLAVYFHSRALNHLRTPLRSPVIRSVVTFLMVPGNPALYTLEGLRYRGYALLSAVVGFALTVLVVILIL